jgi:branched-chain amino acid transport system permease protein
MLHADSRLMRLIPRPETIGAGVTVVVILALLPNVLSSYDVFIASTGLIMATILLGLGIVTGRGGMMVLCQLSFMAAGAYVFLWMQVHAEGVPLLLDILIAGIVVAFVGMLTGLPALRVRGVNLAVITLAFAVMLNVVLTANPFPGNQQAFYVSRPSFAASETDFFWFCAAVFLVGAALVAVIGRSKVGAGWSAVRYSERAAAAKGISVPFSKATALTANGFLAGIAGGLLIVQLGTASIQSFSPLSSLTLFAIAIMMGTRYPEGALLGGMVYAFSSRILGLVGISATYGPVLFAFGAVVGLKGGLGAAEAIRALIRQKFVRARDAAERRPAPAEVPSTNGAAPAKGGTVPVPQSAGSAGSALSIRGLGHSYGSVKVLDDVSFEVPRQSVTALIGPNGAGKSTLIDCVSGFIRGYEGSVELDGVDIDSWSARRRAKAGLRRSFQQDRAIPDLSVNQYVRMGLTRRQSYDLSASELEEILYYFGCPSSRRLIAEVDVGARRLLEAVAAIAARPKIVMLDEPAAGLGVDDSARLAKQIAGIPMRFGSSVVVVEHDMDLVAEAATHVVVIDFGKVIATGPPAEVMNDRTVVGAYLGEEFVV